MNGIPELTQVIFSGRQTYLLVCARATTIRFLQSSQFGKENRVICGQACKKTNPAKLGVHEILYAGKIILL